MDLIIGGAYQGKLDYAKGEYGLNEKDICICKEDEMPDFTCKCLDHFERYIKFCYDNKLNPRLDLEGKVIVAEDIFCGIVPLDKDLRAYREMAGRTLSEISRNANTVVRVFCGIPKVLK